MASNYDDVGVFHAKFGLPAFDEGPRPWDEDMIEFRIKFMQEELDEFKEGVEERDDAKMFDALIDLVYVALGTAHLRGYPWQEGWDEVQVANMAKVRAKADGSDSKRGSAFDVVKPEGWMPPDIGRLLEQFGFERKGEPPTPKGTPCPGCGRDLDKDDVACMRYTVSGDPKKVWCVQRREVVFIE